MARETTTRCAVVGLGVMGSMALLSLARDGIDCVGYDTWTPGHPHGASGGGETRIFRSISTDGPEYTRLLARSRELWQDLDHHYGPARHGRLFDPCGALAIGPSDARSVAAAAATPTAVEVLGRCAAAERWPEHILGPDDLAVLDRRGGLLGAGTAVRAAVQLAQRLGAEVHPETPVRAITRAGGRSIVRTDAEDRSVDSVIVATGRWLPRFGIPFANGIDHRRVVLSWFGVDRAETFVSGAFPPGQRSGPGDEFSFFPTIDGSTIKINMQVWQPTVLDSDVLHPDVEACYASGWASGLARRLNGIAAGPERIESYVEGYTAHRRGLVRLVDSAPRTVAIGGFSGRGFKYAPAVGELAAELAVHGGRNGPFSSSEPER